MSQQEDAWWRSGVIYQVYPRSFQDSNGDGIGDLRGILQRLEYLANLGVDAVWVSPFYPSPMADFGYDVADYCNVDPIFGTLADFDELIAGLHRLGIKMILDFVPNHTSDQHPWFLESRSSRSNPKRDWYLWHDPAPDGGPPNNWVSHFGGSAWTLDAATGQYFYHAFLAQQPDLNWRNPQVRAAMIAAMRFWLDRGVDGFRMDVLWLLIKDRQFRDNPADSGGARLYDADQPETHEIVREMRALLDGYGNRVLIGEIYLPVKALVRYYGEPTGDSVPHLNGAQMPFNFHLIQTAWQADLIAAFIRGYEAALPAGGWPNYVLGNHDQQRLVSRIGAEQTRVAAVLLLTLRGTPTLYNGDELGMPDARIAPEQVRDPAAKGSPNGGRDPERSPMLWENRENAGFTSPGVATWLPLVWDWPRYTVETEEADAGTSLKLYRSLLKLRRERPELHGGEISEVEAESGVLSYMRHSGHRSIRVFLNMTDEERQAHCPPGKVLLSSYLDRHEEIVGRIELRRNEAAVVEIDTAVWAPAEAEPLSRDAD